MLKSLAFVCSTMGLLLLAAVVGCGAAESRVTTQSETEKFMQENPEYAKPAEMPSIDTGNPKRLQAVALYGSVASAG